MNRFDWIQRHAVDKIALMWALTAFVIGAMIYSGSNLIHEPVELAFTGIFDAVGLGIAFALLQRKGSLYRWSALSYLAVQLLLISFVATGRLPRFDAQPR